MGTVPQTGMSELRCAEGVTVRNGDSPPNRNVRAWSRLRQAWALAERLQSLRMTGPAELDDVSLEEQGDGPVDDDPELPREERELIQVIAPRHDPAEEATETEAEHVGDALVAAERRHLAEHPVAVGLRVAQQVLRQPARLAERMLGRRRIGSVRAAIRHVRGIAERPHVLVAPDAQKLVYLDPMPVVERQAQLGEERMRPHARRPDDGVSRDAQTVAQHRLVRADRLE